MNTYHVSFNKKLLNNPNYFFYYPFDVQAKSKEEAREIARFEMNETLFNFNSAIIEQELPKKSLLPPIVSKPLDREPVFDELEHRAPFDGKNRVVIKTPSRIIGFCVLKEYAKDSTTQEVFFMSDLPEFREFNNTSCKDAPGNCINHFLNLVRNKLEENI